MYIDMTYIILVLPAVILSLWASWNVKRTFEKYSKVMNSRGLTGAQAARRVLDANGLRDVPVERVSGELSDHYDPEARVVRLSDSVYGSCSTAAVGVACHEVGHAIQNAEGYLPIHAGAAADCGSAAGGLQPEAHLSRLCGRRAVRAVCHIPGYHPAGGVRRQPPGAEKR